MLEALVTIFGIAVMGIGPLLLGVFILTYGNLKMQRLHFNPIFIIKANIAGLLAVGWGGLCMVALIVNGVTMLTSEPKAPWVPKTAPVAQSPANQLPAEAPTSDRLQFPDRSTPNGFSDVKDRMKGLEGSKDAIDLAREEMRAARSAMRNESNQPTSSPQRDPLLLPIAKPSLPEPVTPPVSPQPRSKMSAGASARPMTPAITPTAPRAARTTQAKGAPAVPTLNPSSESYLRDLKPIASEVLTRDEHRLLRDFSVSGVKFAQGLYAHPPEVNQAARIGFPLGKGYKQLRGAVGQIDGFPPRSQTALTFRILGDGRELWKSRAITEHGDWEAFDVSVAGVEQLELITECPGPHTHAWAAWLNPVLTK